MDQRPIPTPTELGQLLRLSESGEGVAGREKSAGDLAIALQAFGVLVSSSNKKAVDVYREEFNSLWLPSLVRTVLQPLHPETYTSQVASIYRSVAGWAVPSSSRFVRLEPQLSLALFLEMLRTLLDFANRIDHPRQIDEGANTRGSVCVLLSTVSRLHSTIHNHLPEHVAIEPMGADLRAQIQQLCDRFDQDRALLDTWHAIQHNSGPLHESRWILLAVAGQVQPITGQERREKMATRSSPLVWWDCQLRMDTLVPPICTPLGNGVPMEACGKCGAVRYCSRAHQRADWKRHKEICFQPTW